MKSHPVEFLQHMFCVVASDLMSQLQDWNNRREFTSPIDFNDDGASDVLTSQEMIESTRTNDILKQALFLVPFTSRAKIYNSQLATMKERDSLGANAIFTRNRVKIRRDHLLEDAFSQFNALAEEDLRGVIRISYVNEFGAEEAGIDVEEFSKISWRILHALRLISSMHYLRKLWIISFIPILDHDWYMNSIFSFSTFSGLFLLRQCLKGFWLIYHSQHSS